MVSIGPSSRPVTEVQRKLHHAADQQLAQVLALVDAMPARGAADALIAPLRPRLAAIEPIRPMSLTRLLFRPLDAVIMAGPRWRPGMPAVPRTALPALGDAIVGQLGPMVKPVQAMIAGQDGRDQAVVAAAGAELWPAAAAIAAALTRPPDWAASTGLPDGCFVEIRTSIAAVLHQAVPLSLVPRDGADPAAAVKAIVGATQATYPGGLGIVLAILLADGMSVGPGMVAASAVPGPALDQAVEQTLDRAQHLLSTVLPALGLAVASTQAMHVASLLEAIDAPPARPALRAQALRLRTLAEEACRSRLLQGLDQEFLPKLAATAAAADDAGVAALEAVARGLRRLSLVARRLGPAAFNDKVMGSTAHGVCHADGSSLSRMERLRLAEILVGTEAALRLDPN